MPSRASFQSRSGLKAVFEARFAIREHVSKGSKYIHRNVSSFAVTTIDFGRAASHLTKSQTPSGSLLHHMLQ